MTYYCPICKEIAVKKAGKITKEEMVKHRLN